MQAPNDDAIDDRAADPPSPLASIVIPAHDEAAVIGRCLDALTDGAGSTDLEIVVVCNGCADDTARQAGRFPGVRVVEIAEASKIAALNAGDQAATVFPRIYLDADVTATGEDVRAVIAALRGGAPSAAPLPALDLTGCGRLSKAYFRFWSQLGYSTRHLLGSGVYGLSAEGRARFDRFPDLISDDGFVYSHFDEHERVNPGGATFVLRPPRTVGSILRRRTRITLGNKQLLAVAGRRLQPPRPHWPDVVRRDPRLAAPALVFLSVNLTADLVARRRLRLGVGSSWHRDDSSRGGR